MHVLTLDDIRTTLARLQPHIVRTPTIPLTSAPGTPLAGEEVWLKLELFQRTGTFKLRGALNNLLQASLAPGQGVTAVSAGNHAVAVACAAALLDLNARVVMLSSANAARRALAQSYGATLVFHDNGTDAFAAAAELVANERRLMVHPFDGPLVAAATGGVGLELMADAPDLEAVIIAVGGGGLAGGAAAAIKQLNPACAVYGVEPEGADCMRRSIDAGHALSGLAIDTIADSLAPPLTTDYTYSMCSRYLDDVVTVSDDAICAALAVLFRDAHLAVEPAGAAALAGLLGPLRERLAGKRVGIVVCGSCIDAGTYARHLARGQLEIAAADLRR